MTPLEDLVRLAAVRELCATGEARRRRVDNRVSIRETANTVGVSAATVHRWETGRRAPHGPPALRYAELLEELGHQ